MFQAFLECFCLAQPFDCVGAQARRQLIVGVAFERWQGVGFVCAYLDLKRGCSKFIDFLACLRVESYALVSRFGRFGNHDRH